MLSETDAGPGDGWFLDAATLPDSETYTVIVDPPGSATGSAAVDIHLFSDVTGTIQPGGPAVPVATARPGQNARLTFAGTAGQRIAARLSSGTYSGGNSGFNSLLVAPDGTVLAQASDGFTHGRAFLDQVQLPATGTYTLIVDPTGVATGTATAQLFTVADLTSVINADGTSTTLALNTPGQNARLRFSVTNQQKVSVVASGSFAHWTVSIIAPDGGTVRAASGDSAGLFVDAVALPAGTYTLVVDPEAELTGTAAVRMYTVTDVKRAMTIGGPAQTVTTTVPGQNALVTFAGTAQRRVSATITGVSYPTAGVSLFAPNGTGLAGTLVGSNNTSPVTLGPITLPADGTYTLPIDPWFAATGHLTVALAQATAAPARAAARTTAPAAPTVPAPTPARRPRPPAADPPDGVSAITGVVRTVQGAPLPGVTLAVDDTSTRSRADGGFVLYVPPGRHELKIDGRTARRHGARYGYYEYRVDVAKRATTRLPAPIWMTPLDTRHTVRIDSPTRHETVLTTPAAPGLEVHLPKGSVVRDHDGRVVRRLGITTIRPNRAPFPLPVGVVPPVYFTVQPSGGYISPAGARIVYPNSGRLAAGTRVDFWDYEADGKGWYVYGKGRVTPDGRQILPGRGVRVWEFSGAMVSGGEGGLPPDQGPPPDGGPSGGDPVDLSTGLFVYGKTDFALPDVMPIRLTRVCRQNDNALRAFGLGCSWNFGDYVFSPDPARGGQMILPTGGHVVYATGGHGASQASYQAVPSTASRVWDSSRIGNDGQRLTLRRLDGMTHVFDGFSGLLVAVRDPNGNQITITRSGSTIVVRSPNGRWFKLYAGLRGMITSATDDLGRVYSYNMAAGGMNAVTDPRGGVTRFGHDAAGRMTTVTDARGNRYLTTTYDAAGRVDTQTLATGGTYTFDYTTGSSGAITSAKVTDPRGFARVVHFDTNQQPLMETVAVGQPEQATRSWQRDPATERVITSVDPRGVRTT